MSTEKSRLRNLFLLLGCPFFILSAAIWHNDPILFIGFGFIIGGTWTWIILTKILPAILSPREEENEG